MWDVEVNLDFVHQKERNNVSLKLLTKLEDHVELKKNSPKLKKIDKKKTKWKNWREKMKLWVAVWHNF